MGAMKLGFTVRDLSAEVFRMKTKWGATSCVASSLVWNAMIELFGGSGEMTTAPMPVYCICVNYMDIREAEWVRPGEIWPVIED